MPELVDLPTLGPAVGIDCVLDLVSDGTWFVLGHAVMIVVADRGLSRGGQGEGRLRQQGPTAVAQVI